MRISAAFVVFGATMLSSGLALADSWRCGNRLVSPGDLAIEVRARCGDPASTTRRSELRSLIDRTGRKATRIAEVEEWSYPSTGNELSRILQFANGRLVAIHIAGRPSNDSGRCQRQLFSSSSVLEVERACGPATQEDRWVEIVEDATDRGLIAGRSIEHVRLVYNFGPNRFLRIYEFENGVLVRKTTGNYGF